MIPTREQIKAQLKKVNRLACKHTNETQKFSEMCNEYYGEENYSDHDEDQIIDCLDYGQGMVDFRVFDRIMKEINSLEPDENNEE